MSRAIQLSPTFHGYPLILKSPMCPRFRGYLPNPTFRSYLPRWQMSPMFHEILRSQKFPSFLKCRATRLNQTIQRFRGIPLILMYRMYHGCR
jgi:hypothetical protein